jgi:hypothetical protein
MMLSYDVAAWYMVKGGQLVQLADAHWLTT